MFHDKLDRALREDSVDIFDADPEDDWDDGVLGHDGDWVRDHKSKDLGILVSWRYLHVWYGLKSPGGTPLPYTVRSDSISFVMEELGEVVVRDDANPLRRNAEPEPGDIVRIGQDGGIVRRFRGQRAKVWLGQINLSWLPILVDVPVEYK